MWIVYQLWLVRQASVVYPFEELSLSVILTDAPDTTIPEIDSEGIHNGCYLHPESFASDFPTGNDVTGKVSGKKTW